MQGSEPEVQHMILDTELIVRKSCQKL
jgi:DNA-binding LacI/PurR family transcriptional regulator